MSRSSSISQTECVETVKKGTYWGYQLARVGYFAIGVVYFLIGVLAILGIFDRGGQFAGPGGIANMARTLPYGRLLVGLITLGLLFYIGWRFLQAFGDVEQRGSDRQGLLRRAGLMMSGFSYLGLAVLSAHWLFTGGGSVNDPKEDLLAQAMGNPVGNIIGGIVGAAIVGVGLFQFYGALTAGFTRYLNLKKSGNGMATVLKGLGRFGLFWRGVVFLVIGGFMVVGAVQSDPTDVMGLNEMFLRIGQQYYGFWLIGFMAAGLMAYGVFVMLKARYRYVMPVDDRPAYLRDPAEKDHAEREEAATDEQPNTRHPA